MKRILVLVFFLSSLLCSYAQKFGGNPSSIHWQQINTDTVRVIFPKGFDAKAQRISTVVHALQKNYAQSIGNRIRKVSIVLHNQTLLSNAYVGLAPYRSEFYLTPPQNPFELGAVNWADNLAVHEFRHVQQYSNFNKGFSKFASVVLGEQGQAIANAAAVPDWFFEGDAVFNETKLTRQGRGTLPLFLSSYQSLYIANRTYSYEKMRNGSLRQYVPDHYDLGYLLVTYGRKKYGDDIWRKITEDAVSFTPFFYPFQGAVKKYTGIPFDQFVKRAMQYYQQQWKATADEKINWVTQTQKNNVVNYKYPYLTADGSLMVVKSSYQSVPAFYKIHADKSEEKIAVKDISGDDYFSYNNGKIVYAAYQSDARWGYREFNTIKLLDVLTGEEKKIISHTKYLSPDISHDGIKILAVETDPMTESKLVLMDMSGNRLDSLAKPDIFFSNPKFSANDQHCYVAARNLQGEMALLRYGLNGTHSVDIFLPFSNRIIGFITVQSDTILFTTTYKGRDEAWALIDGKERKGPYRLASYATGLYQSAIQANGELLSSAFTANGYRLGTCKPDWERVEIKNELTGLYAAEVYKNADHLFLNELSVQPYVITKYPKSFHLLNIHSYRPFYEPPEYSFTLYGQNVLNTLQSEIAYTYNQNEGSHKLGYNGAFGGWYLQPVFGLSQTWQRTATSVKDTTFNWNELIGYAGLQLPLNLSGGKQYRYLTLSTTFNTEQVKWTGLAEKLFRNANFNYISAKVVYTGQVQKAVQHIYPHWAQSLVVQYKSIINQYTAHQFLATGSFYLPGLAVNHNLVFSAAFHNRDTLQQYLFANNFPFARGYSAVDFPQMWRFGANYHIPLSYPDWGFGGIIYFQRIRANLFYDYTMGKSLRSGTLYPFGTVGTEIFFDTRWWSQQLVTFGIRYSHLLNNEFRGSTQPNVWELILPINLFN